MLVDITDREILVVSAVPALDESFVCRFLAVVRCCLAVVRHGVLS